MLQVIKIDTNACIPTIYKGCSVPAASSKNGKRGKRGREKSGSC